MPRIFVLVNTWGMYHFKSFLCLVDSSEEKEEQEKKRKNQDQTKTIHSIETSYYGNILSRDLWRLFF